MMALRDKLGPNYTIYDWKARSQGLLDALVVERNVMRLIFLVLWRSPPSTSSLG